MQVLDEICHLGSSESLVTTLFVVCDTSLKFHLSCEADVINPGGKSWRPGKGAGASQTHSSARFTAHGTSTALTWKNVGTEKVPKARLCAIGFQDPRLKTLPTSSPTLTSDGESAFLQWIVDEGHLLESGDLKTAFLSGDPDPSYKGSDALYIDPPSDLKRWLNLGPDDVLRLRNAVYGLINALRWHQRLTRALLVLCYCKWTGVFGFSLRPVL